jgi:hypothetical protein
MFPTKAPSITSELERRIRHRVYERLLPPQSALAAEFGVSRETVAAALRPLLSRGLLVSRRRGGTVIDRRRLLHGIVAIVTVGVPECHHSLAALFRQIADDGLDPVIQKDACISTEVRRPLLGILFLNSTLTFETARRLEDAGIPFVSCNVLDCYPHLNYVDFDNADACRQLLERLVAEGYRRIAAFMHSKVESYDEMLRRNFLRLKREFGLPHEAYDDILLNWHDNVDRRLTAMLAYMKAHRSWPEVLLSFMHFNDEQLRCFGEPGYGVPASLQIWMEIQEGRECRPVSAPRSVRLFAPLVSINEVWSAGYGLLREHIFFPGRHWSGRLIQPKFEFLSTSPPTNTTTPS